MYVMFFQLPTPGHSYTILYSVAFVIALVLLIYEGVKRKFPILPWILILAFSRVLLVIGSKIFTFSQDEWQFMLENQILLPTSEKVLYGGLLFWGLGLFISKKWLSFKPGILDSFAVVIPLTGLIIRIGCFLNGCCYGKPSSLPWAVQYPVNSLPHFHHYQATLIGQTETLSLPVHPVQLYEVAGLIIVLVLVILYRNRWKSNGSLFLFSLILYAVVRFITEFFRDPQAHTTGGATFGWLNLTQWVIAGLVPGLLILLIYRERFIITNKKSNINYPSLFRIVGLLSVSAFLIWLLKNWFRPVEIYTLMVAFLLALTMTVVYILKNYRGVRFRLAYIMFLILPFILMSQTVPESKKDSLLLKRTKSFRIGLGTGNFDNEINVGTGEGCDRVSQTGYFNQKYTQFAGGMNFTEENLRERSVANFGLNILAGNYSENKYNALQGSKTFIWDINPYIRYDVRWFGIGTGLHLGKFGYAFENSQKEGNYTPVTGRKITNIYPQFYTRIGPKDYFFLDYHFADFFPSALPGYKHQIGFGSSFGSKNGFILRAGTSIHGFYFSACLPGKKFAIEPLIHFNRSVYYSYSSGMIYDPSFEPAPNKYNLQFSVSLRYELGEKTVYGQPIFSNRR